MKLTPLVPLCVAVTIAMTTSAQETAEPPAALSYSAAVLAGASASDIVVDAAGRIYLGGTVCDDATLPVTSNAAQPVRGGGCDGFVAVLGTDHRLLYATYIGGSRQDRISGIAVDAQGGIYVTGDTTSTDFPTTPGAYDRTCGETGVCYSVIAGGQTGVNDGFVTRLGATGALSYSTYLGGRDTDLAIEIAVDSAGTAHVVGYTSSPDYPTTAGAASATYGGRYDATYTRIAPGGGSIAYSTYVSGEGEDVAFGVALDEQGAAYVTGATESRGLATSVALQPSSGGMSDGWLMKVAADRTLKYVTYFGGTASDRAFDVAVRNGFVYLTGSTCSSDLPGAPARDVSGCGAGFVSRLAADGTAVNRSAIVEGTWGRSVAVDSQNRAYMVGWLQSFPGSAPFEPTADAFQPTPGALGSAALAVVPFDGPAPGSVSYASYVGDGGPIVETILTDGSGGVLIGGYFLGNYGQSAFPVVNAPFASPLGRSVVMHFVPESRLIANVKGEIVLYARDVAAVGGNWRLEVDPAAALGRRLTNPDLGAAKLTAPLAVPADYVEFQFAADAGVAYRLWIRGRASRDHWSNDSVFAQFSDSVAQGGAPVWRIGTASGTTVNLEDCVNCGVSGWGWQDNGYGASVLGTPVRFAGSGLHTIRIQRREDGFSFDQIVLSSSRYLTSAPGPLKRASTVLPHSTGEGAPPSVAEIVLHTSEAAVHGAWMLESRLDAASGFVVHHPDAGAPKVVAMPVPAVDYFELSFDAEAGRAYRLWVRGFAERNYWGNDSVHVQFSNAVNASGAAVWRIGTGSSTEVNLEDCSGCGLRGWGWQDNAWGTGVQPQLVYFAGTGRQVIRVTTREDGFNIDQIVLSSQRFLTSSPGALKNDTVTLPKTQ